MTLAPALPPILLALAAGALLVAAFRAPRTRPGAALARAGAVALLLACLLGVSRRVESPEPPARRALHVLVDASRSMGVADVGSRHATRADALRASWLDPYTLAALRDRAEVTIAAFGERVRAVPIDEASTVAPTDSATRLFDAINAAAASLAPGGRVLVLTDGIDTTGADPAYIGGGGPRIDAVVVGDDSAPAPLRLALVADATLLFDGESTTLRVRLAAADGATGRLRVVQRAPGEAVTLFDGPVDVTARTEVAITVRPRAPAGASMDTALYTASVEAGASGDQIEAHAAVQVSAAPLRVLVIEGDPSWDTRYFLDALRQDPWMDVTSLAAAGPRERVLRARPGPVEPADEREGPLSLDAQGLEAFAVVVLGQGVERWIDAERAHAIAEWTRAGGALVFLRADPITGDTDEARGARAALESVSPVRWGRAVLGGGRVRLTREGIAAGAIDFGALGEPESVLAALPDALATTTTEGRRALTGVWLRADAGVGVEPVAFAHAPVGAGGALAVLSEGLWRWATLPESRGGRPGAYAALWSHTLRRLALGADLRSLPPVRVAADRVAPAPGERVEIDVRVRPGLPLPAPPVVRVVPEGEGAQTLALTRRAERRWTASWTATAAGVVAIEAALDDRFDEPARTAVVVSETTVEMLDTRARAEALADIAQRSGGRLWGLDEADAYLATLGADADEGGDAQARVEPVWRRWWVLAALLSLLGIDWFLRRAGGGL